MARIPLGWMQKWVSKGTTLRGLFPASMGHAGLAALLQCSVLFTVSVRGMHQPGKLARTAAPAGAMWGVAPELQGTKASWWPLVQSPSRLVPYPLCPFQQQGLTPWGCGGSSLHPHADCIRSTGTKGEERQKVFGGFTARGCGSPPQCLSTACPC